MGYRTIVLDTVLWLTVALASVAVVDALSRVDGAAGVDKKECAPATAAHSPAAGCECGASRPAADRISAPLGAATEAPCVARAAATELRARASIFDDTLLDPGRPEHRALLFAGVFIAARIAKRRLRLYQAIGTSSGPIGPLPVSSPATTQPHADATRQSSSAER